MTDPTPVDSLFDFEAASDEAPAKIIESAKLGSTNTPFKCPALFPGDHSTSTSHFIYGEYRNFPSNKSYDNGRLLAPHANVQQTTFPAPASRRTRLIDIVSQPASLPALYTNVGMGHSTCVRLGIGTWESIHASISKYWFLQLPSPGNSKLPHDEATWTEKYAFSQGPRRNPRGKMQRKFVRAIAHTQPNEHFRTPTSQISATHVSIYINLSKPVPDPPGIDYSSATPILSLSPSCHVATVPALSGQAPLITTQEQQQQQQPPPLPLQKQ